ncbi:MAG TPA: S8 family serine peptidase, partial [Thermoanaerobaculia bacterium]
GTSMATPHVAGVAALVWSLAPESTAAQVRNAITTTGRDIGDGGWDTVFGFGVVDALRAARTLAPEKFGEPARRRTAGR